jgi:hypothetical protein
MQSFTRVLVFVFLAGITTYVSAAVTNIVSIPLVASVKGVNAVVNLSTEIISLCCRTLTFSANVTLKMPNALVKIKNKKEIISPLVDLYIERDNVVVDHCSIALSSVKVTRSVSPIKVFPVGYTKMLVFSINRSVNTATGQVIGGIPGSGHCDSDKYGGGTDSRINSIPSYQTGDKLRLQIGNIKIAAVATVP